LARLVSILFGQRITEEATAYKAIQRSAIDRIPWNVMDLNSVRGHQQGHEIVVTDTRGSRFIKARTVRKERRSAGAIYHAVWTIFESRLFWSTKKATPPVIPLKP
jgi:hypothetical protein